MKTFNIQYTTVDDLEQFINSHNIASCSNLLVQIFTGVCDVGFIKNLIKDIKKLLPQVKILASTTSGEILENKMYEKSTVLAFSLFENTKVYTYCTNSKKSSIITAQNLISQFPKTHKAKVAIAFADGLHMNGEEFIKSFNNYDSSLIVSGGISGDNAKFIKTIVATENEVIENGVVVALLFNDNLQVNTKASFGWENIGKTMTITKSIQNRVYEIDGIKAVDIYAKYLGKDIAYNLPQVGIEFPLIVKRGSLNIPRAVLAKYDDGSLIFAGNLNEGDKVTFGYGNVDAILSYAKDTKIYEDIKNSETIFIYSCMARKRLMKESISLELNTLANITSISGFFTYGEFFTSEDMGGYELLNKTMTVLSLSENDTVSKNQATTKVNLPVVEDRREKNLTLKALSHLISQTSLELEEINHSLEQKVQEELQKNRQKDKQMLQQSRLAQMGEMIGMIAHQWRQPLGAITARIGNLTLNLMMKKDIEPNVLQDELFKINQYAQHLSATIDDFRNFFKENKEKNKTTCNKLLNSTVSIVEESLRNKNIKLIVDLDCNTPIITYENEIKQVILNLIKNAEDILIERKIKNPTIHIKALNTHITVRDNGGGIPEDIMDKIFEPYFSTKLKKDGTGLGLYMSKTIVEEHCGGSLSARNDKDGAVFVLTFNKNDII